VSCEILVIFVSSIWYLASRDSSKTGPFDFLFGFLNSHHMVDATSAPTPIERRMNLRSSCLFDIL